MKYTLECTDEQKDNILKIFNNIKISGESKSDLSRWRPKIGQTYYCIDNNGSIISDLWYEHDIDYLRYNIGNVFRTYEKAQFDADQRRVHTQLCDLCDDDQDWDEENKHWFIECTNAIEPLMVCFRTVERHPPYGLYFKSEESAKNAIKTIGEDKLKKYLFLV